MPLQRLCSATRHSSDKVLLTAQLRFAAQRAVAEAVLDNIEEGMRAGAKPTLEHLCRCDLHDLPNLKAQCTDSCWVLCLLSL